MSITVADVANGRSEEMTEPKPTRNEIVHARTDEPPTAVDLLIALVDERRAIIEVKQAELKDQLEQLRRYERALAVLTETPKPKPPPGSAPKRTRAKRSVVGEERQAACDGTSYGISLWKNRSEPYSPFQTTWNLW